MDNSCQSIEHRFYSNVEALTIFATEAVKELQKHGITLISVDEISKISQAVNIFKRSYLIEEFIKNSHQFAWNIIKEQDEKSFMNEIGKIFSFLPADKADVFISVFTAEKPNGERIIKKELRDRVWKALAGMVKLSIKYVKEKRVQTPVYFPDIDVQQEAKNWSIAI